MSRRNVGARAPVETKVTAAGLGAAMTGLFLWLLGEYAFGGEVPEPVAGVVLIAVPGIVAFLAGWAAPHTPRADTPPPPSTAGPAMTSDDGT